jgi:hypothetical protein
MRLLKVATVELVNDSTFSKFAMYANFFGALVLLVLGSRYVGQSAGTPIEMLTELILLLLLCLVLIGLGMLTHLIEIAKAIRDRQ